MKKAFFAPIGREARGIERRNDDVMDDRNAEAPRQTTICEACCYPSNMSTVFFVNATGKGSEDGGGSWWSLVQRGVP